MTPLVVRMCDNRRLSIFFGDFGEVINANDYKSK